MPEHSLANFKVCYFCGQVHILAPSFRKAVEEDRIDLMKTNISMNCRITDIQICAAIREDCEHASLN